MNALKPRPPFQALVMSEERPVKYLWTIYTITILASVINPPQYSEPH